MECDKHSRRDIVVSLSAGDSVKFVEAENLDSVGFHSLTNSAMKLPALECFVVSPLLDDV